MERKIPKKNYILVLILSIFTTGLTFFLMNTYNNNKVNDKRINFISEIKENELKSYITERSETVIYMSLSNNDQNEQLEQQLKEYTLKNNLEEKYIYLDLSTVDTTFYNSFYINYINESYTGNFEIKDPTLVFIKDGKVLNYINNINNIEEVEKFFLESGILE